MLNDGVSASGTSHRSSDRRSEYDVTNTVKVSSTGAVRDAVRKLFRETYPQASFDAVWVAFHDFDQIYAGLHEA